MKPHRNVLLFFLTSVFCFLFMSTLTLAQTKEEKSLYQRIGGYDAIAAVVDDFVPRLVKDPQIGKFFAGHGIDSKKRIRQLVVEQLCQATGGPCFYTGRSLKVAHAGLGITEAEWQAAMGHLSETLDKFKLPEKEKNELLALTASLKGDIVTATEGGEKK